MMSLGSWLVLVSVGIASLSLAWAASNHFVTHAGSSDRGVVQELDRLLRRFFPIGRARRTTSPQAQGGVKELVDELRLLSRGLSEQTRSNNLLAEQFERTLRREREQAEFGFDEFEQPYGRRSVQERMLRLYESANELYDVALMSFLRDHRGRRSDIRNRAFMARELRDMAEGHYHDDPELDRKIGNWVAEVFDLVSSRRRSKKPISLHQLADLELRRPRS